jgi:O-acetylserine/cysteine efflux transporter
MSLTARDTATALLVAAIWGLNFVVIKVGVETVPPLLLTGLRFLFAALPAVFLVPRPRAGWGSLVGFGMTLGVIKFGLLFTAIHAGMPAGLSSLALQLQAFFTILFAALLFRERPLAKQIIGGAVALAGIAVIATERGNAPTGPLAMVVLAAAFWGVANLIAKRSGETNMLSFVVWASLVPPLPLFALSFLFEDRAAIAAFLAAPSWLSIGAIAYLAYPTTVLAFALWNRLLSRYPAATVAPFSLLVPVFGLASAALLLNEPLTAIEIAGSGLVFIGLVINVFGLPVGAGFRRAG